MNKEKIYSILELVKSINKSINKELGCKLGFKKISPSIMAIMFHLVGGESKTLKELSRDVGLANSTVSEIVDKLVKEGYVQRIQDREDRRRVLISATDKALKIREDIQKRHRENLEELLSGVSEEDMDTVLKGLIKLNEIVKGSEAK